MSFVGRKGEQERESKSEQESAWPHAEQPTCCSAPACTNTCTDTRTSEWKNSVQISPLNAITRTSSPQTPFHCRIPHTQTLMQTQTQKQTHPAHVQPSPSSFPSKWNRTHPPSQYMCTHMDNSYFPHDSGHVPSQNAKCFPSLDSELFPILEYQSHASSMSDFTSATDFSPVTFLKTSITNLSSLSESSDSSY